MYSVTVDQLACSDSEVEVNWQLSYLKWEVVIIIIIIVLLVYSNGNTYRIQLNHAMLSRAPQLVQGTSTNSV